MVFGLFGKKRELNHFIVITLDSCRHDTFVAAQPRNMTAPFGGLERVEKRYSYASWTAPSHYNLLTGLMPHTSPPHVYASEYYKQDFFRYRDRLGIADVEFKSMVPSLWLPTYLKGKGYETHAMVSLPVLNPATGVNKDFDTFDLMPKHNDMMAMVALMEEHARTRPSRGLKGATPQFYMLNVGETHYPYALPDEPRGLWPQISGVHGVFKKLDEQIKDGQLQEGGAAAQFFDQEKLDQLRARQVNTVRYLDEQVFPRLYDLCPKGTWITLTADHGELFGENGYFGHGPILHDKCLEVPFIEGLLR